jgi:hypothetical protein
MKLKEKIIALKQNKIDVTGFENKNCLFREGSEIRDE